jgi:hypothetical protein
MPITKLCTSCQEHKELTYYYKNKARKDGIDVYCKECSKARRKKRLSTKEGKAKHNADAAKWREANRDKFNETQRNYRERNKEKIAAKRVSTESREYNREYMQDRRKDPTFRMRCNVSRNVSFALRRTKGSKRGDSVFRHLPYTPSDLVEHLESQFDDKMSWDNYGDYWHVDHIYPQSLLPYSSLEEENFQKCWALENLQPLEATENMKKSNKVL